MSRNIVMSSIAKNKQETHQEMR